MKKATWFTSVLLSAALCLSSFAGTVASFAVPVFAEEEYYEEDYEEEEYYEDEASDDGEEEPWFVQDPTVDTNEIKGWPQGDTVDADSAVLMDAETGAILYAKHMDEQKYPASITKIMTVLLGLEHGNLKDVVKFSEYAVYSIEFGSAHLGLTEGEELTLEQCLYGIMLASANEISNAVAEYVAGDVETFAKMMNEKAESLGCKNTHFVNPNGLHDDDHYVCARDMALITQEALKYDKFREIINTDEYHYPPTNLVKEDRYFVNHHQMLMEESYDGIIGGKTGFTDQAFNTLVTCAERDGMTLIAVVLHAPGIDSEYGDTRTILDYGFDNFEQVEVSVADLLDNKREIAGIDDPEELEKIKAADFTEKPFAMDDTITVTMPKGKDISKLKVKLNFKNNRLTLFFNKQRVGSADFTYTGVWEKETETETEKASETRTASEAEGVAVVEGTSEAESAAGTESASDTQEAAGEATAAGSTESLSEAVTPVENESTASEAGIMGKVQSFITTTKQGFSVIHELIAGNDMIAVVIGGILLIVFVPLLILSISRNIRYNKMMKLRIEEMHERKRLEEEIERQSASQIEAELRARELEFQLEMEKKKNELKQQAETVEEQEAAGTEELQDSAGSEEEQ